MIGITDVEFLTVDDLNPQFIYKQWVCFKQCLAITENIR